MATIENLQQVLQQALTEKKQVEDKMVSLQQEIASFMAALQSMDSTLQAEGQRISSVVPQDTEQDTEQNTGQDTIKNTTQNTAQPPVTVTQSSVTQFCNTLFWSYIVPACVMFAILWAVMSYLKPEAVTPVTPEPQAQVEAQVETQTEAEIVEQVEQEVPDIPDVATAAEANQIAEAPETKLRNTKVHFAITDLVVDLKDLDLLYGAGQVTKSRYEQVLERWQHLQELLKIELQEVCAAAVPVTEADTPQATTQDVIPVVQEPVCMPAKQVLPLSVRTPVPIKVKAVKAQVPVQAVPIQPANVSLVRPAPVSAQPPIQPTPVQPVPVVSTQAPVTVPTIQTAQTQEAQTQQVPVATEPVKASTTKSTRPRGLFRFYR